MPFLNCPECGAEVFKNDGWACEECGAEHHGAAKPGPMASCDCEGYCNECRKHGPVEEDENGNTVCEVCGGPVVTMLYDPEWVPCWEGNRQANCPGCGVPLRVEVRDDQAVAEKEEEKDDGCPENLCGL